MLKLVGIVVSAGAETTPSGTPCFPLVHPVFSKNTLNSQVASVERGMVTQVVIARLMMDERNALGTAVKIGIQVAAKIGGEPCSFSNLPLPRAIICGYDTYHDTANRGRSFGAFVASG